MPALPDHMSTDAMPTEQKAPVTHSHLVPSSTHAHLNPTLGLPACLESIANLLRAVESVPQDVITNCNSGRGAEDTHSGPQKANKSNTSCSGSHTRDQPQNFACIRQVLHPLSRIPNTVSIFKAPQIILICSHH